MLTVKLGFETVPEVLWFRVVYMAVLRMTARAVVDAALAQSRHPRTLVVAAVEDGCLGSR